MTNNIKFDFDDILIVPAITSEITSRYKDITLPDVLPLFTAPMDTVVSLDNIDNFINNKINVVLPRTIKYEEFVNDLIIADSVLDNICGTSDFYDDVFISLGFEDIELNLKNDFKSFKNNAHILIDVASGHMQKIVDYAKSIKNIRPDIKIMVGNIANPETYLWYAENDCVDYIRVGIGNGGGCFLAGTKIITQNGIKNIEDVEINDSVLTHQNTFNEVINKISYINKNENIIKINNEIECTEKHKFYVVEKKYKDIITDENIHEYAKWVEANELDKNKHLLIKLEKMGKYKLIEISEIQVQKKENQIVYDMTVENTHSYIANNYVVHNCLTTKQSGIGFPMASLIYETYQVKRKFIEANDNNRKYYNEKSRTVFSVYKKPVEKIPAIVADGGMKNYSDIIKAFYLGADYVMVGSIFNKALESCADNYLYGVKINKKLAKYFFDKGYPIKKHFRGMSTKGAQKAMGKTNLKTSEGVTRYRRVEYHLDGWVENFEHYLRNAMSYSNSKTLQEFIGKAEFCQITKSAYDRFNK